MSNDFDLKTYDFTVDESLIAASPYEKRDRANLLVCGRSSGVIEKTMFHDIERFFRAGDMLVLNDTKVFKARLLGRKVPTLAQVEIFLLRQREGSLFEALVRPSRRVRQGTLIQIEGGEAEAQILDRSSEEGVWLVDIKDTRRGTRDVFELADRFGHVPLPPYIIKKKSTDGSEDIEGYQTVFASRTGSVAAPTAGFHFTRELLEKISSLGVTIVKLSLHVGIGTFRLVDCEDIREHKMHSEPVFMNAHTHEKLMAFVHGKKGGRLICCGTTSVRAVESLERLKYNAASGEYSADTDLFIYPGYSFKYVDAMITNFHLPRSTLYMMVSAFMGTERAKESYEFAQRNGFRFYSYGDAMLII